MSAETAADAFEWPAESVAGSTTGRWAGRFRRMKHRLDPTYQSVDVAVCGAVVVQVVEWVQLETCPQCYPATT